MRLLLVARTSCVFKLSHVALAGMLLFSSCALPNSKAKVLGYSEARSRLVELVDEAVKAGLKARPLPVGEFERDQRCMNDDGSPSPNRFHSIYGHYLSLELLSEDPDRLVDAAEKVWLEEGLEIVEDNKTPGVVSSFATGDGFYLEVFVNHNTDKAHIGGSGPCATPPSPPA
ncbi:MAG: hypothetical protein WD627_02980 [Actinomycetota bacterium]